VAGIFCVDAVFAGRRTFAAGYIGKYDGLRPVIGALPMGYHGAADDLVLLQIIKNEPPLAGMHAEIYKERISFVVRFLGSGFPLVTGEAAA